MSSIKQNVVLRIFSGALLAAVSLSGSTALAQSAVLTGTVTDAATKQPVADAVMTLTSPALQGEQIVVTDATGTYRFAQLPSGTYSLRVEKESYKPYSNTSGNIQLRLDQTAKLAIEMLPEAIKGEDIVVVGRAPTVDVGSTTTGVNVSSDFIRNIAVVRPGGKGSAARSFESLAIIAPGAQSDAYGISISGTTSPENQYVIDGLSVNDPGFGLNATPLTVEFISEVNVITGGYMPEFGRATGGIMNVVTKSGSNEFHGSVFGNWTPGILEGQRTEVVREGSTISTKERLWNLGDFGVEVGGPILKDKLWFFAGFAPSYTRNVLNRELFATVTDAAGVAQKDATTGFTLREALPGTQQSYFADQQSYQYIGKLTYAIAADHNLSLSVYGTPTFGGNDRSFGIDPNTGGSEVGSIAGPFEALAHRYTSNSTDVSLKLSSSFNDKKILLDVSLGWHHQDGGVAPSDGSKVGSNDGLAGISAVAWRRTPNLHNLQDFAAFEPAALSTAENIAKCTHPDGSTTINVNRCPVTAYRTGGPGFLGVDLLDRYQGKVVGTYLLSLVGHHVIKAGLDVENVSYRRIKAYSGSVFYRESTGGGTFADFREYGYLIAPDEPVIAQNKDGLFAWDATSKSTTIGGFIQDSWAVADLFTINAGVRYDNQEMWGADNKVAITFANQVSPRIGLVYDFTQQGRSKLYANYARFYENALLDMVDRSFPGERQIFSAHFRTSNATRPGCDPRDPVQQETLCRDPRNLQQFDDLGPNNYWLITGGDKAPVDPNIKPQSSDELVFGAEYELLKDARIGGSFTKRNMNDVVEDMSRDEATTYFLGNPGSGIAKDFPTAVRDYYAGTVYINKTFSDLWLAQASYTYSVLSGNYSGLFRPESGQLDPNINSDFDLVSLLDNRMGALPGDRTHQLKVFGAKEFVLNGSMSVNLGLTYTGRSGAPLNLFASHPIYGADEVFVLPRGAGGRLPWIHNLDGHIGYTFKATKDNTITVSADVFNIFNFQGVTAKDQRYTAAEVQPVRPADCAPNVCTLADLDKLKLPDGTLAPQTGTNSIVNPNYNNPTAYQAPRSVRFGAKVTF